MTQNMMTMIWLLQLVVVSPMVRTLETATGVFGNGIPQEPGTMMMTALEPRQQWQAEHAAAALPPGIPVIAHEGCRERVSKPLVLSLLQ